PPCQLAPPGATGNSLGSSGRYRGRKGEIPDMSAASDQPAPGCQGASPGNHGPAGQHGGHGHGHGEGGGHTHRPGPGADARYLVVALLLLAGFMLAEVIAAVLSGSLALLSDAGHMLSDVGAIA